MPIHHNKHVRFAYKNIFHSPPATPVMPPLTFSGSTVPSSLGVITPPSPYNPLPTPTSARSPRARPHWYLDATGIDWDMMDHPSAISRHHQSVSSRAWKEPATTPALPRIYISIPNFPWTFEVRSRNGSFVTFEDVVEKIYYSLRKNITQADFVTAGSPADQQRAARAYEQRYRRQRSQRLYEEEKRGGMKRVDFLMGRTRFLGLVNNPRSSDQWQLSVT